MRAAPNDTRGRLDSSVILALAAQFPWPVLTFISPSFSLTCGEKQNSDTECHCVSSR